MEYEQVCRSRVKDAPPVVKVLAKINKRKIEEVRAPYFEIKDDKTIVVWKNNFVGIEHEPGYSTWYYGPDVPTGPKYETTLGRYIKQHLPQLTLKDHELRTLVQSIHSEVSSTEPKEAVTAADYLDMHIDADTSCCTIYSVRKSGEVVSHYADNRVVNHAAHKLGWHHTLIHALNPHVTGYYIKDKNNKTIARSFVHELNDGSKVYENVRGPNPYLLSTWFDRNGIRRGERFNMGGPARQLYAFKPFDLGTYGKWSPYEQNDGNSGQQYYYDDEKDLVVVTNTYLSAKITKPPLTWGGKYDAFSWTDVRNMYRVKADKNICIRNI